MIRAIHKVRTHVGRRTGGGSVQEHTGAYRMGVVMEREYVRSLTIFLLFFSSLKCEDFTNTWSKNLDEQTFEYIKVHSTFLCRFSTAPSLLYTSAGFYPFV